MNTPLSIRIVFLALLAVLTCSNPSSGQSDVVDSLNQALTKVPPGKERIDLLNELSRYHIHKNNTSVMFYARRALKASREWSYSTGLANAFKNLGMGYIPRSNYDSAMASFDSAYYYVRRSGDQMLESEVLNGMGITMEETGNYSQAIDYYMQSMRLKRQLEDQTGIGKLQNNLGKAYYGLGAYDSAAAHLVRALDNPFYLRDYSQGSSSMLNLGTVRFALGEFEAAKELFERALVIETDEERPIEIATLTAWLGYMYFKTERVDSALLFLRKSLGQFEDMGHPKGVAALIARIAEIYMVRAEYDSALYYLQSGVRSKNKIGDRQDVAEYMVNIARCYEALGNDRQAEKFTKEAILLAEDIDSKSELAIAYNFLHTLYAKQDRSAEAYEALSQYMEFKDSVLNDQKLAEISRLETIYSVNQLQSDNERLAQEKETQDLVYAAELRRQNVIKYSFLGGLLLVMLLAVTYYRSYRRKQRANELLEEKNELITRQKEDMSQQADELKVINEKLEQLSAYKEGLTHMIAHDMKNPLHIIISLTDGKVDSEKLKTIGQSGKEMLNLVTNMLDIQKFEEAKMDLKLESIPVIELIDEARAQTELLSVTKNLKLVIKAEPVGIRGDRQLLVRTLVNLMTNAIKYSPLDAEVIVAAHQLTDDTICLKVQDQGPGIPEDELSHVFEKFWQANARKSGNTASTGLGLTFCQLAVEAHGGQVAVESAVGEGTTFSLTLPYAVSDKASDREEISFSHQEKFTSQELAGLEPYHAQLSGLKVHQISQINSVLSDIELTSDQSDRWKQLLKSAVFSTDQNKYDELVGLIK